MLVAVTLRTVALIIEYDFSTGYFSDKTLITIADWLTVAAVLGSASYIFATDRSKKYVATYDGAATYIPSALVAVALICLSVGLVEKLIKPSSDAAITVTASNFLALVLALAAAAAFFVACLRTRRRDATRAAYQICAALFFTVYAAYIYFDNPLPINVPCRIIDIMAYISAAVFFIYEIRISLGRDIWYLYTTFGLICICASAYSAIPSLITYFVKGASVSHSIQETLLTIAILSFASLRLVQTLYLFEDTDAATVAAIKSAEQAAKAESKGSDSESETSTTSEESDNIENENYTFELSDAHIEDKESEEKGIE